MIVLAIVSPTYCCASATSKILLDKGQCSRSDMELERKNMEVWNGLTV